MAQSSRSSLRDRQSSFHPRDPGRFLTTPCHLLIPLHILSFFFFFFVFISLITLIVTLLLVFIIINHHLVILLFFLDTLILFFSTSIIAIIFQCLIRIVSRIAIARQIKGVSLQRTLYARSSKGMPSVPLQITFPIYSHTQHYVSAC
jgi:hypothetical protein